jgi:hypothetical protein
VDLLKVLGGSGLKIMTALVNKIYEIGQRIFWMLKSLYNIEKSYHREINLFSHTGKIVICILSKRLESN